MGWRGDGLRKRKNGYWYWRRVHPVTGRRVERATGTKTKRIASKKATAWDEQLERESAGLKNYDWARLRLADLIPEFLVDWGKGTTENWVKQRKKELERALAALNLKVIADLDDVGSLDRRVRRLDVPDSVRSRAYQQPLKAFSRWLAENNRVTERNLLANWKKISYESTTTRHAVLPEDMARAFLAATEIDGQRARHPLRPALTALLVTAPRATALTSRDVSDLAERTYRDEARYRIDYGEGCRKKRRGRGAVDPTSWAEIQAYVGPRKEGPLFLSPKGCRWSKERLLDAWREAYCLGLVTQFYPAWSYHERMLLVASLHAGEVTTHKGGPPPSAPSTVARRDALRLRLEAAVERLQDTWDEHRAVDVHTFRMTHRTWAQAAGVPAVLIDLQLGHAVAEDDSLSVLKAVVASRTGRKHYLDDQSEMVDPTPSAVAVRSLLDEALANLANAGGERRSGTAEVG